MIINTQDDWIKLAEQTIPLLGDYMAIHRGQADPDKITTELSGLFEAKNWAKLHERFEQLWQWLPDDASIRRRPFFDLCDLCSEYWVFTDEEPGHDL